MDLRDRLQSALGSAYSVERELGGGGMSRVFLAQETALGRKVVVKLLSGDTLAGLSADRFAREVRLAASLQHPNIVPVHSTGVADGIPYYTMPYVRGESLRARMKETAALPPRQVVSILRDVARALQYAHGEGVVHRDIKPDNVLLSGDVAVVTDFGIAKAISLAQTSAAEDSELPSGLTLTQAGLSVGTPAYMAPEQAAADMVDHRADLYSWGILAYELLAGTHPFAGKTTPMQLMAAQLSELPAPLSERAPGIAPTLAVLVMHCLQKSPDDRPSSALELLDNLDAVHDSRDSADSRDRAVEPRAMMRRPRSAAVILVAAGLLAAGGYAYSTRSGNPEARAGINSVAVLPFADDRADSANAYFGEGIADELMSALGKVPGLRVASRTSAIAVGSRRDLDVREIGRLLGVSTVVEGTVRSAGGQLRITAQATNAADGLTLWSDAYQREDKDVFAVQREITQAIVDALRPEFASGGLSLVEKAAMGPGTSNLEAYDLYLRGSYLLERRGPGVARSADYFSQAIQKDPEFARAYAGLANALVFLSYFAGVPAPRVEARIRAAAERSLELDSSLAEPRVALAMTHWHALRWKEAEAEFRRAIVADSTFPIAHIQYGRYLLTVGRAEDALKEFRIARVLDPLGATAAVWLAYTLGFTGNHAAAWEESKRARELAPTLVTARTFVAFERIAAGRLEDARSILPDVVPIIGFAGQMAYTLQMTGDTARAAAVRKNLDAAPDTTWMVHADRAMAYLATKDTSRALSEMEASLRKREIMPQAVPWGDQAFDPIRRSARFAAVVRKAGLDGRGLTGPRGGRPSP